MISKKFNYFLFLFLSFSILIHISSDDKKKTDDEDDFFKEDVKDPNAVTVNSIDLPTEKIFKVKDYVEIGEVTTKKGEIVVNLPKSQKGKRGYRLENVYGSISFKTQMGKNFKLMISEHMRSSLINSKNVTYWPGEKDYQKIVKNLPPLVQGINIPQRGDEKGYLIDIEFESYSKKTEDKVQAKNHKGKLYFPYEEKIAVILKCKFTVKEKLTSKVIDSITTMDYYFKFSVKRKSGTDFNRNPVRGIFSSLLFESKKGLTKESQFLFEKRASKFDTTPFPTELHLKRLFCQRAVKKFSKKYLALITEKDVLIDKNGNKNAIVLMKNGAFSSSGSIVNVHTYLDTDINKSKKGKKKWAANMYNKGLCFEALNKLKNAKKYYEQAVTENPKAPKLHKDALQRVTDLMKIVN